MNNTIVKKERNYSIDLFKIFSMFLVVAIHTLNGVVTGCEIGTANEYIAKLFETLVFVAVNCFALSSGYILINIKYKFSRIITMWLQVFLYSVVITSIFFILAPDICSKGDLLKSFFPFMSGRYWYFTSYAVLFLVMPFLNIGINSMTKKQHTILCMVLFTVFCIVPIIAFDTSLFSVGYGFSFLWLTIVYVWGAYFGRYGIKAKTSTGLILFFVCGIITFLSRFQFFLAQVPVLTYVVRRLSLYHYDSATLVIGSIGLLIVFANLKINGEKIKKIISFISPLTFGVYLIHNNQLMKNHIFPKYLPVIGELSPVLMIIASIGCIAGIFVVCLFIDWLRLMLFKLLKINKLSDKIGTFVESTAKTLAEKFN